MQTSSALILVANPWERPASAMATRKAADGAANRLYGGSHGHRHRAARGVRSHDSAAGGAGGRGIGERSRSS